MKIGICPFCNTNAIADWPYTSFVSQHHHPIRRYFKGLKKAKHYKAWLKDYYETIDRVMK